MTFPTMMGKTSMEADFAFVVELLQFYTTTERSGLVVGDADAACAVFYCATMSTKWKKIIGVGGVAGFIVFAVKLLANGRVVLQRLNGALSKSQVVQAAKSKQRRK